MALGALPAARRTTPDQGFHPAPCVSEGGLEPTHLRGLGPQRSQGRPTGPVQPIRPAHVPFAVRPVVARLAYVLPLIPKVIPKDAFDAAVRTVLWSEPSADHRRDCR